MTITNYNVPLRGQAGQLAYPQNDYEAVTKTTESVNIAMVEKVTLAATWAENDTCKVTIRGVPITSTTPVAATIESTIDEMVADWNADEFASALAVCTKEGTTKAIYTAVTAGQDITAAAVATTAGDGTATRAAVTANQAALDLEFGIGVAIDSNDKDNRVILPVDTNSVFAGVTLKNDKFDNHRLAGNAGIPAGESFSVLTRAYLLVYPEETVTTTDPVYWRFTASGALAKGHFRKDADTDKAKQLTKCRWVKGGTTTNPAILFVEV